MIASSDTGLTWYAVYTGEREELLAQRSLHDAGYVTFYPHFQATKRVRNGRRKIGVLKPLFPRYLFIAAGEGQGLYDANNALGVNRVLSGVNGPYVIQADIIEAMRARCNAEGLASAPKDQERPMRPPRMKPGAAVVVIDGPLKGSPGFIDYDDGESRDVVITVDMFGRQMRTNILAECLKETGGRRRRLDRAQNVA